MEIQVESILFENAVNTLVDMVLETDPPGYLHLPDITFIIMKNLRDPHKLASLAAMAVVMLAEKRREHEHADPTCRPAGT